MKRILSVLFISFILISCDNKSNIADDFIFYDDTVVMSINDIPITYDIYRYYFLSLKINYDTFDIETEKKLLAECVEAVKYYSSVFVFAEKNGISFNDNDISDIISELKEYTAFYGTDGFSQLLDSLNHTRNSFIEMSKWQKLYTKCIDALDITKDELESQLQLVMDELQVVYDVSYDHISFETVK